MVQKLLNLGQLLNTRYVMVPAAIVVGAGIGLLVFFLAFPGKPAIGVIEIPYTVITDRSATAIVRYLDHARKDDSIEAVVISITSPGGGAAASERLYLATRKLKQEKPVVMVMEGLVASGGYMMAMGASETFVQPSSLVGNVGVIVITGPLIPSALPEIVGVTGPHKLSGGPRQHWISLAERLKSGFAQMVVKERGDRLRITEGEVTEGRLYIGADAVDKGLADHIGVRSDAVDRAAQMAGISNYKVVDVNTEVQRILRERAGAAFDPYTDDPRSIVSGNAGPLPSLDIPDLIEADATPLADEFHAEPDNPLADFPLEIGQHNLYYLYANHTQ